LEAGWAPEPIWTRWQREKLPTLAGNRTSIAPIVQPIAVVVVVVVVVVVHFFNVI
jgi:hypothetical protein